MVKKNLFLLTAAIAVVIITYLVFWKDVATDAITKQDGTNSTDQHVSYIQKNLSSFAVVSREESVPNRALTITTYTSGNYKKVTILTEGNLGKDQLHYYFVNGMSVYGEERYTRYEKGAPVVQEYIYYIANGIITLAKKDGVLISVGGEDAQNLMNRIALYNK